MKPFVLAARFSMPVLILITALALWPAQSGAQEAHADYVVMGKSINHRQTSAGELGLLNTVFFAEVFKLPGGIIRNAILHGPGEAAAGLRFSDGDIHFLAGTRRYSIEALTEHFPDETYFFSFDTPDGNVRRMPVRFERDAGESRNPGPIRVTLKQGGVEAEPVSIDPEQDLEVSWSPFSKGSADPKGIIDDMIYVMMGDCMGNETVHSGHAISNPNALTYVAERFVIPASKLAPGQPFQLEVEHSNMDTAEWQQIEQIITYAATTFLDIRTTGEDPGMRTCPHQPYAMDGGQTDRERLP